jgi:hypothetical protein
MEKEFESSDELILLHMEGPENNINAWMPSIK